MKNYRLALISLVAMWCVVIWHCYCGSTIERLIIPFCYWAVPWFFCVSGYFIVGSFDKRSSWGFLESKIYSLLFPYVLWCLLGVAVFALCSSNPITLSLADVFALKSQIQPMYNKPLWYIRALMIFSAITMIVLSSLSIVRMRKSFLRVALFSAIFLIIYVGLVKMGVSIGPGSSALYFVAGAVASSLIEVAKVKAINISRTKCIIFASVAFFGAGIFRGFWFATGHSFSGEGQGGVILGNLSTIFVIVALIFTSLLIPYKALLNLTQGGGGGVLGISSFVYLFHRPLLMCIIEHLDRVVPQSLFARNVEFILLSMLYAPFCVLIGLAVKRFSPRLYSIITGGR